ncbi:HAUS augmin-like complex subunit 7 [Bombina bombina]|uniref:HAUS augmin-like complex subunit 7 n=1 Tax=Bombina bombina TaxID=8345 RepID=UPI00235AF3C3|nr:HAUS augmin-like complex subunit 7 [Bombina bombina]
MAGGSEQGRAAELYERLKRMSCPCLEGIYLTEPQSMLELLCTPSAHRLEVLEWICARVYPPLHDQLSSLKESQTDLKVKEMAKLGFDLMLCRADDLDLIKGQASPHKQLSFMGQLLDVVHTCGDPTSGVTVESASLGFDKAFVTNVRENEELLKVLFSSPHFHATLTPECSPWPADLKPLLLAEDPLQKRAPPPANAISQLLGTLQEVSAALQPLKEECTFLESSTPGGDTLVQTMKLVLTDFYQLVVAFNQVYENEFQEHCSHSPPHISQAGPLFQTIHQLLEDCSKELEAIAQFTQTSENIVEVVEKRQNWKESWGGSNAATLYEKIQELKQIYDFL